MNAQQLGLKIQELRKLKGMTQEDLADRTGLSVRTIQRIENGEVDPRTYTLNQIAEALNVEISELTDIPENENGKNKNENNLHWLFLFHLSGLFILVLPPILIWVYKKDQVVGIKEQFKDVMNFQLSMVLYLFSGSLLLFVGIGIIIMPLLGLFSTFVIIINSVRVASGSSFKYPLSIRFIK